MLNHDDTLFADPLRRGIEGGEVKGYRIESLLGRGALTLVYAAGRSGTRYALKAIPLEGPTRDAERLKKLRHEHLVTVYEVFSFGPSTWLVCDVAAGRTDDQFPDGMLTWEVATQAIITPTGMANPLLAQRLIAKGTLLGALHQPSFPFAAGRGSWLHNGHPREYVAVEFVSGADLKTYLTHKGRFAESQALWVAHELATAMEHAYESCRLVHRDLKPANLAVSDGDPRRLMITDFATALFTRPRDLQDFSTAERSLIDDAGIGKAVGTPAYMSPEQVRGEHPIPQMDMYAFDCVLYQLLAGETPFNAPNAVMLMQYHLDATPPDLTQLAEITPSTAALVARCLAKHARDRFPTWKHLLQSVQSARYATQAAKRRKDRGQTASYTRSHRPGSGEHRQP